MLTEHKLLVHSLRPDLLTSVCEALVSVSAPARPRLFFWVPQPCLNRPLGGLLSLLLGHSLQGHRAPMGALLRSPLPTMS